MISITSDLIEEYSIAPSFHEYLKRKKTELEEMKLQNPSQTFLESDTARHNSPGSGKKNTEKVERDKEVTTTAKECREMVVYDDSEAPRPHKTFVNKINEIYPFPRESRLNMKERKEYSDAFHRYLRYPVVDVDQQLAEINHQFSESFDANVETNKQVLMEWHRFYNYLHPTVSEEQREFQRYASMAAKQYPGFSARFGGPREKSYVSSLLQTEIECRLAKLPTYFKPSTDIEEIDLTPSDGQKLNLGWVRESEITQVGCLPKVMIPTLDRKPYPSLNTEMNLVEQRFPATTTPADPDRLDWKLPVLSADPIAAQIAEELEVDIVISASSLVSLLNNNEPHFSHPWALPVHVKRTSSGRRYVVVDKSLKPWCHLSEQYKKYLVQRRRLDIQLLRYPTQRASVGEEVRQRLPPMDIPASSGQEKEKEKEEEKKEDRDDLSSDGEGTLAIDVPPPEFEEDDCPRSPDAPDPVTTGDDQAADPSANAGPRVIPLERVSESEAEPETQEEKSPRFPSAAVRRRCWVYALWRFAGKRLLIRYALHGEVRPERRLPGESRLKKVPAYLQLKIENQPFYGCECLTFCELWKAWVASLLRGRSEIVRVRSGFNNGFVFLIERETSEQMQQKYPRFKPRVGAHLLHNIFDQLDVLSPGVHLLMHEANDPKCRVFSAVEESLQTSSMSEDEMKERNIFDLGKFARQIPAKPNYTAWLPLDLRLVHMNHRRQDTVPCLFDPPVRPKQSSGFPASRGRGGRWKKKRKMTQE